MSQEPNKLASQITERIVTDAEIETDAKEAKSLLEEQAALNQKLMRFQQRTGTSPQNVIMTFAFRKLSSPIIQPS